MGRRTPAPFDPIERGARQWAEHYPEPERMQAITSVMRVHQLLLNQLDEAMKPFGLTFARFEVLVLLAFSRRGEVALGKLGERLQVHATSVTPLVNRLEAQGLVARRRDPDDGRAILASLTDEGRRVLADATQVLADVRFGLGSLTTDECDALTRMLAPIRRDAGDFD